MTPAQLKEARHALGLSASGLAALVGAADGRTVRRWEDTGPSGRDIPAHVDGIVKWKMAGGDDWLICSGENGDYVMHMIAPRLVMSVSDAPGGGWNLTLVAAFDAVRDDVSALARLAREGGEVWALFMAENDD